MFKVILLTIFSFTLLAQNLSKEEQTFFNSITPNNDKLDQAQTKISKLKFTYSKGLYKTKKFTALLKKGSVIQNLDGSNTFKIQKATVLRAEEVSPGSIFSYLINKRGKAVYVCRTIDLEDMDELVTLNPKKYSFVKDNFEYHRIDNDKGLILNLLVTQGNHNYSLLEDSGTTSSYGLSAELGMESSLEYPMMIVANFTQLNSPNISWSYANLGLKISKFWNYSKNIEIGILLQAEKSIYGKSQILGNEITLKENRFSVGPIIKWNDNIFSIELAAERLIFPNTLELNSNGISNTNTYHKSLIIKIGKQFEINI